MFAFQCKCDFCDQKFSSWNGKVEHVEDYHKIKKGILGRRPDWGDFRVGGKQYVCQKINTMLGKQASIMSCSKTQPPFFSPENLNMFGPIYCFQQVFWLNIRLTTSPFKQYL